MKVAPGKRCGERHPGLTAQKNISLSHRMRTSAAWDLSRLGSGEKDLPPRQRPAEGRLSGSEGAAPAEGIRSSEGPWGRTSGNE